MEFKNVYFSQWKVPLTEFISTTLNNCDFFWGGGGDVDAKVKLHERIGIYLQIYPQNSWKSLNIRLCLRCSWDICCHLSLAFSFLKFVESTAPTVSQAGFAEGPIRDF